MNEEIIIYKTFTENNAITYDSINKIINEMEANFNPNDISKIVIYGRIKQKEKSIKITEEKFTEVMKNHLTPAYFDIHCGNTFGKIKKELGF